MSKPFAFLDVDGVFNPDVHMRDYNNTHSKHRRRLNAGGYVMHHISMPVHDGGREPTEKVYPVLLSSAHRVWLEDLSEVFEPVWATTWQSLANLHVLPRLGWTGGMFPVVEFQPRPDVFRAEWEKQNRARRGSWKLDRLMEYAGGRPFWFFDDQTNRYDQAVLDAVYPGKARVRHVPPSYGWDRRMVDEAVEWAVRQSG